MIITRDMPLRLIQKNKLNYFEKLFKNKEKNMNLFHPSIDERGC